MVPVNRFRYCTCNSLQALLRSLLLCFAVRLSCFSLAEIISLTLSPPDIRIVQVMRYVTPLREGGSLPAIAEADDGFLYVLKFRGAGQGKKALVADFIGAEIARAIGLKVPEVVFAELDEAFGRMEPDEEIQDLLKASQGLNLGLHYLSGAITYDPAVNKIEPQLASEIVWLDALLTNVDRTARNTNMLTWRNKLWLIDHGAALYFHHSGYQWEEQAMRPFVQIKDHVLLPQAKLLQEVDEQLKTILTPERIAAIVSVVPDSFLTGEHETKDPAALREVYVQFLNTRIQHSSIFVNEAINAGQMYI